MCSATLFHGGPITTMDPANDGASAVVVDGGRIAATGPLEQLTSRWPGASLIDLRGRHLLPGFIDAHHHLSFTALQARWADLGGARELGDIAKLLRTQSEREPDAEWVRGFRWEASQPLRLNRHDLDALDLDRPVIVGHFSLHMAVVCSKGLDALGIDRHTEDPPGGELKRDGNGVPTGLLIETAWSQAHATSLAGYTDSDRFDDHLVARMAQLHRHGITAVHDAACPPVAEDAYRRLRRDQRLTISILTMPHASAILQPPAEERLDGPPTGEGDELLRVGPVKLFADGGAYPNFSVHHHGEPIESGYSFPDVAGFAERAAERGFRLAVHAMGNRGMAHALRAFQRVSTRIPDDDHRFRLEHATLALRQQLEDLRDLGGTAVVQPAFVNTIGSGSVQATFDEASWMPFADMIELGLPIAASSDEPCSPCDPLTASRYGVTRTTDDGIVFGAGQSVDMDVWLRAWTMGAAAAGGQEHERGSLTPGKRADLVIIDGDPDPGRPVHVSETWIGGQPVFVRPTAGPVRSC
jgi:predicted amidohydrolase YtcJ